MKPEKLTLKIIQDSDPTDPRDWDNLGTMYCEHRRYILGDKNAADIREEDNFEKQYIILPLYLYDHSGLTISTSPFSCPWDSGQVGYIYVSKEKIKKEYSWPRLTKKRVEKIRGYLRNEVQTYDYYLTGAVYGFIVENQEGTQLDSCFGFYGHDIEENGITDYLESPLEAYEVIYE